MHRSSKLSERRKDDNFQWARDHMNWTDKRLSVLFNEKKNSSV